VSLSVDKGLVFVKAGPLSFGVGIYKITSMMASVTQSYKCSEIDEQFKDINKPDKESLIDIINNFLKQGKQESFQGNDDGQESEGLKNFNEYCRSIRVIAPIVLAFNAIIVFLTCLIKMNILKNTNMVRTITSLLSIILLCANISLIVMIVLKYSEFKKYFSESEFKVDLDYVFYLICVSLVMSLASFIIYLLQPIKKG
jgi:hypothetical protein